MNWCHCIRSVDFFFWLRTTRTDTIMMCLVPNVDFFASMMYRIYLENIKEKHLEVGEVDPRAEVLVHYSVYFSIHNAWIQRKKYCTKSYLNNFFSRSLSHHVCELWCDECWALIDNGITNISFWNSHILLYFRLFISIYFFYIRSPGTATFLFCSTSRLNTNQFHVWIFCFLRQFVFSAGGLVTAVCPVVIKGNGLWVGWPGIHLKEPLGEIPESDPSDTTPTAGLRSDQVRNG